MVCINGHWQKVESFPNCDVPYDFEEEEPVDYEEEEEEDEGRETERPPDKKELIEEIIKYTAVGAVVFAVSMLLLPSRKS